MNTRTFLRQTSLLIVTLFTVFLMSSCMDLGGFDKGDGSGDVTELSDHDFLEYYSTYYKTFGDICMTKQDCSKNAYQISKSFFNKECVNETRNWDQNSDCVEYNEYCYLSMEIKKDITLDSISLYIKAKDLEEDTYLEMYVFIVDSFDPSGDFRTYDKWQEELNKADDDDSKKSADDFSDLDVATAFRQVKISVNNYDWNSFTVAFLEKGSSENLEPYQFHEHDWIVIMFKNNMGLGLDEGLSKIKLSSTNFIARANND